MSPFLTSRGRWVLLAGVIFLVTGALAGEPVILLLGQAHIVVLAIAFLISLPTAYALDRRRLSLQLVAEGEGHESSRSTHVAGDEASLTLVVSNASSMTIHSLRAHPFASGDVSATCPQVLASLSPGAQGQLEISASAEHIGRWSIQGCDVVVAERLGLFESRDYLPCVHTMECYPGAGRLRHRRKRTASPREQQLERSGRQLVERLTGGTEVRELRPYNPGDPLRNIAWKATARTRRLIAREFDHEASRSVYVVLDVSSSMRSTSPAGTKLDHVLELTSDIAERLVRDRHQVGLITFDEKIYGHIPPATTAAQVTRIAHHLVGLNSIVDADLTELDDTELTRVLVEYLLVQERLDFRRGQDVDPQTGINLGLLNRWVESVIAEEEHRLGSAVLNEGRVEAEQSLLRRFLQLRGLSIPYRPEARLGMKERGLLEALEHLSRNARGPQQVVIMSDLCGVMDVDLIQRGLNLLRLKKHSPTFVVPFTPAYHDERPASKRHAVVRELFTAAEYQERNRIVERIVAQGISVRYLRPDASFIDPTDAA